MICRSGMMMDVVVLQQGRVHGVLRSDNCLGQGHVVRGRCEGGTARIGRIGQLRNVMVMTVVVQLGGGVRLQVGLLLLLLVQMLLLVQLVLLQLIEVCR